MISKIKGLKFLDPVLCTEYNYIRTSYADAIGQWMVHPACYDEDLRIGRDCGHWISAADAARLLGTTAPRAAVISYAHQWRTVKIGHARLYHREDVELYQRKRVATKLAQQLGRTDRRHVAMDDIVTCPVCGAIAVVYAGVSLCEAGHRFQPQQK